MTARRKAAQPTANLQEVDEAARLGREMAVYGRMCMEADEAAVPYFHATTEEGQIRLRSYERQRDAAGDIVEGIEARLATLRPQSREGAFAQLIAAGSYLNGGMAHADAGHMLKAAERLLYAVVGFLETEWNIRREDFGADYCMPRKHDPLLPADEL